MNKLSISLVLISTLLIISVSTIAITGDTEKPIHIESDVQSLDIQNNIVIFSGNVIITQGTIKINADKVIVARPNGEKSREIIDGYGHPNTSFYQIQDNGKSVEGHASKIHYELTKDLIVLEGNAYLKQLGSNITGDKITYLVKEHIMQAYSEKGRRVTTVLIPSQLQSKSNIKIID